MSAFQPCHIAPALVTTSHLPGPIPRAASVQKGKGDGRRGGGWAAATGMRGVGEETSMTSLAILPGAQPALSAEAARTVCWSKGARVQFQSLSPGRGRGGAIQASPPAVQIPLGDTWLWSVAMGDWSGPRGEQVSPPSLTLPQFSAYTARLPKTEPSCFKKRRRLDLGVFPNIHFIAKLSERSRRNRLSRS